MLHSRRSWPSCWSTKLLKRSLSADHRGLGFGRPVVDRAARASSRRTWRPSLTKRPASSHQNQPAEAGAAWRPHFFRRFESVQPSFQRPQGYAHWPWYETGLEGRLATARTDLCEPPFSAITPRSAGAQPAWSMADRRIRPSFHECSHIARAPVAGQLPAGLLTANQHSKACSSSKMIAVHR
jgi:hypothetical protein